MDNKPIKLCNSPNSTRFTRNRHLTENLNVLQNELLAQIKLGRANPHNYGWLWRAARLAHFRAMQEQTGNPDAARALFAAGAEHAHAAAKLEIDRVEAAFWAATCDLEAARLGGKLAAAASLGRAQKQLNRAAQIDERYHFAGPLRVLGRVTHLKPLILGGNLDYAIAFFERALQISPANSTTLLYYADALIADNQPGPARRALKQIAAAPALENWVWESERDRELARVMMAEKLD